MIHPFNASYLVPVFETALNPSTVEIVANKHKAALVNETILNKYYYI
jgi:hypothetical protein